MFNLTFGEFSYDLFNQAITIFKDGAQVNIIGTYDSFSEPTSYVNYSILPQYYDPALTAYD